MLSHHSEPLLKPSQLAHQALRETCFPRPWYHLSGTLTIDRVCWSKPREENACRAVALPGSRVDRLGYSFCAGGARGRGGG